jgi:hypothetical protein
VIRARAVWRALLVELCEALEREPAGPAPGLLDEQLPAPPRPARELAYITPRVALMRTLVDALAQPVPFTDGGAQGAPEQPGTPTTRPRRRRPDYG